MTSKIDPQWLAEQLNTPTIRAIAMDIATLIREKRIAIGSQLPSVRELAEALGVSPATISAAWSQLRRQQVISGRGRTGMWVSGQHMSPRPERFEKIGNFGDNILADLTLSAPDPALLPDLSAALQYGASVANLNSYQRTSIIPELEQAVRPRWPYVADAFITADGGFDGLYLVLQALLFPGSTVAVESPTAARVLDMIDHIGMEAVMVECDEQGPIPASLQQALAQKPMAFIYQPRTHSHSGHAVSLTRMTEMAALLAAYETLLIVEDDGVGELSAHPAISLGKHFPERTLHIRSFSKAYGPDLRLAVMSGTTSHIAQIQAFRNFRSGWSSRILQGALSYLLTDASTQYGIAHAREVYHQRRQKLVDALARRGIYVPDNDSLCVWLPVPSERYALVTLAARGIAVQPGERAGMKNGQYIRLSICQLPEHLADTIAEAVSQIFC